MDDWPYNTRRWQRLRRLKLATDPLCEYFPLGAMTAATQVDHRKRIADCGDPWAMDNLASCCASCHSKKTFHVDMRGKEGVPMRGCDANGMPIDPEHEWSKEKSLRAGERRRPQLRTVPSRLGAGNGRAPAAGTTTSSRNGSSRCTSAARSKPASSGSTAKPHDASRANTGKK